MQVRDRQRDRSIDLRVLRRIARSLLRELLQIQRFDLGIQLVSQAEITRLNQTFLHHAGSTDVITFDYSVPARPTLHGDILICVCQAMRQARRFRTTWQAELVRYLVHGVLHLIGYSDRTAGIRRKMKREEDRFLRELSARFSVRHLQKDRSQKRAKSLREK